MSKNPLQSNTSPLFYYNKITTRISSHHVLSEKEKPKTSTSPYSRLLKSTHNNAMIGNVSLQSPLIMCPSNDFVNGSMSRNFYFRVITEHNPSRVNDAVVAHQWNRDFGTLHVPHPQPVPPISWFVWHHTHNWFHASIKSVRFNIRKPHLQNRCKIGSCQLKHHTSFGSICTNQIHNWHRGYRVADNAHALKKFVLAHLGTDDGPANAVDHHVLARIRGVGGGFIAYYLITCHREIRTVGALKIEGALLKLGYGIVSPSICPLLVYLFNIEVNHENLQ